MKAKGITLGKGYGEWKNDTFRVANFPAITDSEFEYLMKALN
jgi:phosphoserine aminotransferase